MAIHIHDDFIAGFAHLEGNIAQKCVAIGESLSDNNTVCKTVESCKCILHGYTKCIKIMLINSFVERQTPILILMQISQSAESQGRYGAFIGLHDQCLTYGGSSVGIECRGITCQAEEDGVGLVVQGGNVIEVKEVIVCPHAPSTVPQELDKLGAAIDGVFEGKCTAKVICTGGLGGCVNPGDPIILWDATTLDLFGLLRKDIIRIGDLPSAGESEMAIPQPIGKGIVMV